MAAAGVTAKEFLEAVGKTSVKAPGRAAAREALRAGGSKIDDVAKALAKGYVKMGKVDWGEKLLAPAWEGIKDTFVTEAGRMRLAGNIGIGAGWGAAIGGVTGLANGDGFFEGAASGAVKGATLGAAGSALGGAARGVNPKVMGRLNGGRGGFTATRKVLSKQVSEIWGHNSRVNMAKSLLGLSD